MKRIIGVIGVGRMGLAVCERLVAGGLDVTGHDRRPEAEAELSAAGGRWMADIGDLLTEADVLITVLPGSQELGEVMQRAMTALGPEVTWIDMTSAAPSVGAELMHRAEARGTVCVEAALGGGVEAAKGGTLQLFAGGPAASVAACRTLLERLGTVEHVGEHGAGYLTKLLVNALWFTQAVAVGEALVHARREGIDLERLLEVLGRGPAASAFVGREAPGLLRGDYLAFFGLDRCCAQLEALVAEASAAGLPCGLTASVRDIYREALARYGPADGELLPVAHLEEQAGLRLRPGPS